MRKVIAAAALCLFLFTVVQPAQAYTVVDGFLTSTGGVEPYQVILNMRVEGVLVDDSIALVLVCSATAGAWYAASTTITRCDVASSSGDSVSAIVPMSMSGPESATAGAGVIDAGTLTGCIAAEAQFILSGPHVSNATCGDLGGI